VFIFLLFIFLSYLYYCNSLSEYIFLNWTLNAKSLNVFFPLEYLRISFIQNPILWVSYFIGVLYLAKKRIFNDVAFLSLGLLGSVYLTKSPYSQYYMMAMPFVAMVAAFTVFEFFKGNKFLIFVSLIVSVGFPLNVVVTNLKNTNTEQLKKISYVLSVSKQDDFVYDGDILFNLFREDIDYFWFSVRPETGLLVAYQMLRNYNYDVYSLIEKKKPMVISNSYIDTQNSVILDNYEKSSQYEDLYLLR